MRNYSASEFNKGETIWPVARVPAPVSGNLLLDTHLVAGDTTKGTGYDRYVYDLTAGGRSSDPSTAIATLTVEGGTVSDVMMSAITNDEWWTGGGSGYTFRDTNGVDIPAANLAGGHTYRIVYFLNTTNYGQVVLVWDKTCVGHPASVS